MSRIQNALNWCLKIANDDSHGYDQEERQGPDYDCSSLISNALNRAGYKVPKDSYTGNLYSRLKAAGFVEVPVTDPRKAGDIFLTPNRHVVMCVDGNRIVHASGNEKGKATGGKSGDQTGREICVRDFYIPSYGWKYHLRAKTEITPEPVSYTIPQILVDIADGKYGTGDERKEKLESMGYDYRTLQSLVNDMLSGGSYAEH